MPKRKFRKSYRHARKRTRVIRRLRNRGRGIGRRFFKLRTALDLSADVGGTINYTWSLTSLSGSLVNINGAGPTNSLEEVTQIGGLFDQYRVHAIKFSFIPQLPNDSSAQTGYFPLYTVIDRDTPNTSPPVSSIATAIQYSNLRVKNMYRPWKRYLKVGKYAQAGQPLGGMDLANIPNYGCCQMFGQGFDASQNYGKIIATYYVSCIQRR